MSVKFNDPVKGPITKHYRIRNLDDGGYYISTRITFKTLEKLVAHYLGEPGNISHMHTLEWNV